MMKSIFLMRTKPWGRTETSPFFLAVWFPWPQLYVSCDCQW